MLTPEFKAQLEANGHRVVYARVVVHYDGDKIDGLDLNGEPEVRPIIDCKGKPITSTVIIPANSTGKWYFGDDAETIKSKMQTNKPDLERTKENEKISSVVSVDH